GPARRIRGRAPTSEDPPGGSELCERLAVVADVARVGNRVRDLPAHDALLVDDEGAAGGETRLVVEDAVGPGHLPMRPEVRQQRKLVPLLVPPGPLREHRVDRHRHDLYVALIA